MDDEYNDWSFDLDGFLDRQEKGFVSEFGWPDSGDDEAYSGEEGDGD